MLIALSRKEGSLIDWWLFDNCDRLVVQSVYIIGNYFIGKEKSDG